MSYQIYRSTTLGNALEETLDELVDQDRISQLMARKILNSFDAKISAALDKLDNNGSSVLKMEVRCPVITFHHVYSGVAL